MSLRVPEQMQKRIDYWMARQRIAPDQSKLALTAIEEFLDREGVPKDPDASKKATKK